MLRFRMSLFALLFVGLIGAFAPHAAFAAGTVYVDDTGVANAARSGQCGRPNYAQIQAAVDASPAGGKIVVCAGTYVERVTVASKSLTLEGRSGAIISAPAAGEDPIVTFAGPQTSRIRGFTITGAGSSGLEAGIRVNGFEVEAKTIVTIARNHVIDIPALAAGGGGIGIFVEEATSDVTDNTVERYGQIGIVADGNQVGDTFSQIDDNTVRGQGLGGANATQIALRIDETTVDVEDNSFTGNYGSGPAALGVGILVEFAGGSIRDNVVANNGTGVRLEPSSGLELRSNEVHDNAANGIELLNTSNATIAENESDRNGGDGISLISTGGAATGNSIRTNKLRNNGGHGLSIGLGATGNTVKENRARPNAAVDIVDANGLPLANTYSDNRCDDSNPAGLCE